MFTSANNGGTTSTRGRILGAIRIVLKALQLSLFGDGEGAIKQSPKNYLGQDRRGRAHWRSAGIKPAQASLWHEGEAPPAAEGSQPATRNTQTSATEVSAALALAPKPDPQTAAKLRNIAERMEPAIQAKLNPGVLNQNPTERRARIGAFMMQEGERLQRTQRALMRLADHWDDGDVPDVLRGVKTRALVEHLVSGRRYLVDRRNPSGATRSRWPRPYVHPSQLKDVAQAARAKPRSISPEQRELIRRLEMDAIAALSGTAEFDTYLRADQIEPFADAVRKLSRQTDDRGRQLVNAANVLDYVNQAARAWAAGLDTEAKWDQAANLIHDLAPSVELSPREKRLAELKRGLIGTRIPGYFPTPTATVSHVLELADIKPGMTVLEPSAGKGNIADAVRDRHPDAGLSVIEINSHLREVLELNGHDVVASDFLEHRGEYDRVVMNPPFEAGQDVAHVRRAYEMLKPGGRLVSIMGAHPFFASDRASVGFRDWLSERGGIEEKLPAGAFLSSERPTGVSCHIVVVDKPASIAPTANAPTRAEIEAVAGPNSEAHLMRTLAGISPLVPGTHAIHYLWLLNQLRKRRDEMAPIATDHQEKLPGSPLTERVTQWMDVADRVIAYSDAKYGSVVRTTGLLSDGERALVDHLAFQYSDGKGWWIRGNPVDGSEIKVAGASGPFLTKLDAIHHAVNMLRHARAKIVAPATWQYQALPVDHYYGAQHGRDARRDERSNARGRREEVVKALVYLHEDDLPVAGPEFTPALVERQRQLEQELETLNRQLGEAA